MPGFNTVSFNPCNNPVRQVNRYSYFTAKEIELLKGLNGQ